MIEIRRKRSRCAPAQFKIQSEVPDDLFREQTNKVRISRQSRIVIGKDFLRSRRATDVIVLFQEPNPEACAAKIAGCHKAVVTCTENYHIVLGFHFQFRCKLMVTSNIAKQTSNLSWRKGFIRRARDRNCRTLHLLIKRARVAGRGIDVMLNDERDANSRRTDLLRMWDFDLVGDEGDSRTGGIGVRSCLDCGITRCPGTSSIGKIGVKDFTRCESSRWTRNSINYC